MARIHGRNGRVYAAIASGGTAEPVPFLTGFTIDFSVDKVDVTCLGDTNKTYASGLPDAQGTVNGFYDTDTAQFYTAATDGVARKVYFYPTTADTGEYWFGTALFDFGFNTGVTDGAAITASWAAASAFAKVAP